MRITKLLLAATIAASSLIGFASAASAASVTELSCSGPSLVQQTLRSGSGWEMCWRIDSYRGLVIDKVAYTPRDEGRPLMVLDSIGLAQLNVPYDTGMTEYNDVTTYQVGGRRMQDQTDIDCPDGEIRSSYLTETRPMQPVLCVSEQEAGLAHRTNITNDALYAAQGTHLVLHTVSRIGWYEYQTEYRFHDDGEISVRLGATGDLSPNDFADAVNFGWPIGEGDTDFAVNHYHSAFWRVAFDLDSATRQQVEKIESTFTGEYGTTGDTGHTPIIATEIGKVNKEQKVVLDNRETYRVVNPDSLNADGHARSYEIVMDRAQAYALNPETDYDLAFSEPKSDEIFASYNLLPTKPNASVTNYVEDRERLTKPVAWVNVGFHHVVRDEDQSPMPIHWQGFTLYPRDFMAQNPNVPEGRKWVNGDMRGVPNPNITPTPTPTPTASPTTGETTAPPGRPRPTSRPTPRPTG